MTRKDREDMPPVLPTIDRSEVRVDYARSSGPGGQNVNKRMTKADVRWHVGSAEGFTEEQKALIRAFAGKQLNSEDEVYLYDQTQRSREQNRENALRRLDDLVRDALTPEKERKATKVPRASRETRLREKGETAKKKSQRRVDEGEW